MPGILSFLQRPHRETRGLKDITILRAGTAHRGRGREERQDCSSNFPGHIVPVQTYLEANENKMTKKKELCFKVEPFGFQKAELVLLLLVGFLL